MSVIQELNLCNTVINFIGLEGSGKTDLSKKLSSESGLPIFPTGDTLRRLQKEDFTELGDAVRAMFASDGYLDGTIMLKVLEQGLKDPKYSRGLVMDGGLRTVEETAGYRAMLKRSGRDFQVFVVKLDIPEELGIKRLLNSNRQNRKPDTPESIAARHNLFKYRLEERVRLIKEMQRCQLIEVDATKSPEHNFSFICSALISHLSGDLV